MVWKATTAGPVSSPRRASSAVIFPKPPTTLFLRQLARSGRDLDRTMASLVRGFPLMKRVLMVAFHFPPMRGSSGIQRTLRFVQHLPKFGWEPLVLTAHERAYEETNQESLDELSPKLIVKRAFALDTARHLSLLGRYPSWLAVPDRWSSWYIGGVISGLRMVGAIGRR